MSSMVWKQVLLLDQINEQIGIEFNLMNPSKKVIFILNPEINIIEKKERLWNTSRIDYQHMRLKGQEKFYTSFTCRELKQ